jgi:hypothetical protein
MINQNDNIFSKEFANKIKKKYLLPNTDDYFGVLMGLFRLQDTYKLEPKVFLNKTLSRFYPTVRKLNCNSKILLTFKNNVKKQSFQFYFL